MKNEVGQPTERSVMDFATIIGAISSVGFPIVFCIMLWKTNRDTQKAHEDEVKNLMTSIDKLTLAIQRLFDKMGGGDVDDKG